MAYDPTSRKRHELDVQIVRDPAVADLRDSPAVHSAAVWVLGVWRCLEEIARLPTAKKSVSGIDKPKRLRMWVWSLFTYLCDPAGSEMVEYSENPFQVLVHTKSREGFKIASINAPSRCYAVVWAAGGTLLSLERATAKKPILPLRQITSPTLTFRSPLLPSSVIPHVIRWIDRELPHGQLQGLYNGLLAELTTAKRIAAGQAEDYDDEVYRKQRDLRRAAKDNDPDLNCELILRAMYALEQETGEVGAVQKRIRLKVIELKRAARLGETCGRGTITDRLDYLERLDLIERPRGRASLTAVGRQYVRRLGPIRPM